MPASFNSSSKGIKRPMQNFKPNFKASTLPKPAPKPKAVKPQTPAAGKTNPPVKKEE